MRVLIIFQSLALSAAMLMTSTLSIAMEGNGHMHGDGKGHEKGRKAITKEGVEHKVTQQAHGMPIDHIPEEMLAAIFVNLTPAELIVASQVSQLWHKIALQVMTTFLARSKIYYTVGKDAPEHIVAAYKFSSLQCPVITDHDVFDEVVNMTNGGDELQDAGGNRWQISSFMAKTPHNPMGIVPGNFRDWSLPDPLLIAYYGPHIMGAGAAPTPMVPEPAAHPGSAPHKPVILSQTNAAPGQIFGLNPNPGPHKPLAYLAGNAHADIGRAICHYTLDTVHAGNHIELDLYLASGTDQAPTRAPATDQAGPGRQ